VLLRSRHNRLVYVGPGRSTNLGDRAMFVAHQSALSEYSVHPLPVALNDVVLRTSKRLGNRSFVGICLGGGTLVGGRRYRHQLERLTELRPDVPRFTLGVGVEDPRFNGTRPLTTFAELKKWADELRGFTAINVRGPDSQALLAEVGLASRVTGDPALLLGDTTPQAHVSSGVIGLNVGVTTELWGNDPAAVLRHTMEIGRLLTSRGYRIRLIPVWPPDRSVCAEIAEQLGSSADYVGGPTSIRAALDAIRDCDVMIAMKLHALVFAASVFVPTFALVYRPKCMDFQASIGRLMFATTTDSVEPASVADAVVAISEDRNRQIVRLSAAVAERRRLLAAAVADANGLLWQTR
jgi:hypothetical protein